MTKPYNHTTQHPKSPPHARQRKSGVSIPPVILDILKCVVIFLVLSALLLILSTSNTAHAKNPLPLAGVMGNNVTLSKFTSGTPNRHSLAFFVPQSLLAPRAGKINSTAHLPPVYLKTGVNRHFMAMLPSDTPADYDGVTSQNKPIHWRICGAVACKTESEPRHPLTLCKQSQSVVLTQNLQGVANNG